MGKVDKIHRLLENHQVLLDRLQEIKRVESNLGTTEKTSYSRRLIKGKIQSNLEELTEQIPLHDEITLLVDGNGRKKFLAMTNFSDIEAIIQWLGWDIREVRKIKPEDILPQAT